MSDLQLRRTFPVSPEKLFGWVTTPDKLLKWWGPEGVSIPEHDLDLSRTGPWYSVMQNSDGQRFHVSGQVTHVDVPKSVGFTWAWHEEDGSRGAESHVTLTIAAAGDGAMLVVDHRDLGDDGIAARHEEGWTSTLRKLEAELAKSS
ncbi:SRPBCC domain-containing protein [Leisingera aquaemixtae]|uniref:SRPBCC family protein n=1 Tax=Leisingera TaxID=191028 RepID=UPI001C95F9AA|nr:MULTISPECIES: SRPBCC domain-containing protein [Leisingera]MBY6066477.1 SRPBCC domain-containing protein [Leisingera aquaemixtae]MCB4456227.1 SRPBCC domain-containing protein [Leisingera sp. McT4-56]